MGEAGVPGHEILRGVLVVRVEGPIDEACGARVADLASSSQGAAAKGVILDLAGLDYLSSLGVAVLLKLQTALAVRKRTLAIASPTPLVRRILHQAGIAGILPIHSTVDAACGQQPPTNKAP